MNVSELRFETAYSTLVAEAFGNTGKIIEDEDLEDAARAILADDPKSRKKWTN